MLEAGQGPHEVRVAAGPPQDVLHLRGVRLPTSHAQELRDLLAPERLEIEPPHGGQPAQLADQTAYPWAGGQAVGADRRHDGDAFGRHPAQQEAEEVGGRAVHPLQILDHHDRGAAGLACLGQASRGPVEELPARRLVGGVDRCAGVIAAQGSQEVGHGEVRQARLTEVDALRPEHQPVH